MRKRVLSIIFCLFMLFNVFVMPFEVNAMSYNDYKAAYNNFINDSRWKNGASYGNRGPYISPYGSVQCCAYCADFVKYVYGLNSLLSGQESVSTNVESIRAGDVIFGYWPVGVPHWFVVLERNSDGTLYTAEGNFSSKARVTSSGYYISGSVLYGYNYGAKQFSIEKINHYSISSPHTHSYTSSVTTNPTCTANGVRTYRCFCGSSYTESISATGHKWNSGEIISSAGCTTQGVKNTPVLLAVLHIRKHFPLTVILRQ